MVKISPKILVDGFQDLLVVLPVASIQVFTLFGVPSLVSYWLTGNQLFSLLVAAFIYAIFILFSVFSLSIGEDGFRFNRLCGSPKVLSWDEIIKIEPASQRELIIKGWVWPVFPAKEMTPSLSSRGHFKIIYRGGYCFYPPKNPEEFTTLIRKYKSSVL